MVIKTETPFQKGFLMGLETKIFGEGILAPNDILDDSNALERFNKGVRTASLFCETNATLLRNRGITK